MTGEWLDGTKVTGNFVFMAEYTIRRGADEFTGRYLNPTNKAQADVKGVQTDGTWVITMKYTGDVNKGQVLKAIGEGLFQGTAITITGTYKRSDAASKVLQEGKFKMTGTCKPV
ncbi:MAG: hypothetical protein KIT31_31735 [Deltaproteobacteria bacterium]|nr:hypothetical protein [Deltaproteobacteria bacterium]